MGSEAASSPDDSEGTKTLTLTIVQSSNANRMRLRTPRAAHSRSHTDTSPVRRHYRIGKRETAAAHLGQEPQLPGGCKG